MVDWQFTVFCREVGFVEIYAFLVLIFLAKIVSAFFITFCISAAIISAIAGGNLLIISASNLDWCARGEGRWGRAQACGPGSP